MNHHEVEDVKSTGYSTENCPNELVNFRKTKVNSGHGIDVRLLKNKQLFLQILFHPRVKTLTLNLKTLMLVFVA